MLRLTSTEVSINADVSAVAAAPSEPYHAIIYIDEDTSENGEVWSFVPQEGYLFGVSSGDEAIIGNFWRMFNSGTFFYEPGADWSGSETFTFVVVYEDAESQFGDITFVVRPVNDDPRFTGFTNQVALEDQPFAYALPVGTVYDVDQGDTLTVSAALADGPLPSWLSFDAVTQTFSGNPTNADVGMYTVTITATDSAGASSSSTIDITVQNTNDGPVMVSSIGAQQAQKGVAFSYTAPAGQFTDEDVDDIVTLSATLANGDPLPGWLTFAPSLRTFSGTPGNADAGQLSIRLTATDSTGASASNVFSLTVAAAGPGADALIGSEGLDALDGLGGNDTLVGLGGNDSLDGGDGNDRLDGGAGYDILLGGAGSDILDGGANGDTMTGGVGNDIYVVDNVNDKAIELAGGGYDTVRASVSFTLGVNVEALEIGGTANYKGIGNDEVNKITGNGGLNTLEGRGGNDTLLGGAGADSLIGGTGNDTLSGGAGADTFIVLQESLSRPTLETDTVTDFDQAGRDKVDLRQVDANLALSGDQAFALVSTFSKHPGQAMLFYTAAQDVTTLRLDIDGDGRADYQLKLNGDQTSSTAWLLL